MLNRTLLIGCSLLCVSSALLANGGMTYTKVADQKSGWSVGVEALYLEPSNGDLTYALVGEPIIEAADETPINGRTIEVNPDYDWGFTVMGRYYFPGAKNDLTVSYTRFRSGDSDSVSVGEGPLRIWSTIIHPDNRDERGYEARAKVDFDYDAVDVLVGQFINTSGILNLNLAAGVRYARLNVKKNAFYRGTDGLSTDPMFGTEGTEITLKSRYSGIGPRAVATGNCDLMNGFGLKASIGASLLIGDLKVSHYQYDYQHVGHIEPREVDVTQKMDHLVPEMDADLGLTYTYNRADTYKLVVGAGWRVTTYAEGRNRLQFHDENAGALANNLTNVSFNGPYVGVHVSTM